MSGMNFYKKSNRFKYYNFTKFTKFNSSDELKEYYIKSFSKNKSSIIPNLVEKFIAFSCYYTFGLTGLLLLMLNILSKGVISKFMYLHTFQSLLFAIGSGVFSFVLVLTTRFTSVLFVSAQDYQIFNSLIYLHFQLFMGLIVTVFALAALFGKKYYLPGVEKLAKSFVN